MCWPSPASSGWSAERTAPGRGFRALWGAYLPFAIAALVCSLALGLPRDARGEPTASGVGLYCPDVGLSPYQLFDEIERFAGHLSAKLGSKLTARAYKRPRDLRRDMRAGKIQLAVVSALYLASTKIPGGRVLAVASHGGKHHVQWTLLAKHKAKLVDLKQAVLQLPDISKKVSAFVEHGLLGSNLALSEHFKIVKSPGLYSALEAVKLGAARVVLAPVNTKGLQALVETSVAVPRPVLVALAPALGSSLLARVKQAALSYRGGTEFGQFIATQSNPAAALKRRLRRQRLPLLAARPAPVQLTPRKLLEPYEVVSELPPIDLQGLFLTTKAP